MNHMWEAVLCNVAYMSLAQKDQEECNLSPHACEMCFKPSKLPSLQI